MDAGLLSKMAGAYLTPTGTTFQVTYQEKTGLSLVLPGAPPLALTRSKGTQFRSPQFSDLTFEFVVENGQVKAMKQRSPDGAETFPKK